MPPPSGEGWRRRAFDEPYAMLITNAFVYIHFPKTGGSFVTNVLKRLYGASVFDVKKHGTCREIPVEHAHKPLVSTLRHPLSRLVSHYEFRYWQRHPRDDFSIWDAADVKARYPSYPELSFGEYVALWNDHWIPAMTTHLPAPALGRLGVETYDFLRFFARDPDAAMAAIAEDPEGYARTGRLAQEIYPVRFLRMDALNAELRSYLEMVGWEATSLAFLREAPRLCPEEPERRTTWDWRPYYEPALLDVVMRRERALLAAYEQGTLWSDTPARADAE